jgi:hypothetical protein
MDRFLTPKEGLALELIFQLFKESSANRVADHWNTIGKYIAVATRARKLAVLHADINKILAKMAAVGFAPYENCAYKPGDRYYRHEKFPTSLSIEVVRAAWKKSGMRELQLIHKALGNPYKMSRSRSIDVEIMRVY